jgi:hypothetical protein
LEIKREASNIGAPVSSGKIPDPSPPKAPLDSARGVSRCYQLHHTLPMGQQTNKHIKKKRRIAYLKRKKAAAKKVATKKTPKAKK